jgi:predicted metal-dependent phosphoesterase TrpH
MRYDLQVHTHASPCSRASPEEMVQAAVDAGLDGIAITNHDIVADIEPARAAAGAELEVIAGIEVTTTQGHLLGLGVREAPPQSDPISVVDNIHEQGGVAILSHPFDRLRQYYTDSLPELAAAVDAVEVLNSRCLLNRYNHRAEQFSSEHELPRTGGSDAHFPMEVGRAATETPTGADILDAIREGETTPVGRARYLSGHAATKLSDGLGLVGL